MQEWEWKGRKGGTSHGSHISDLVALEKSILLCSFCQPKFEPAKHGYTMAVRPPFHNGAWSDCDACGRDMSLCRMYVKGQ